MEAAAAWRHQNVEVIKPQPQAVPAEDEPPRNGHSRLHALAMELLQEVQTLEDGRALENIQARGLDGGLDFYDEVKRFEIDLIKRALRQTAGHQSRAAKLLSLKISTLNAKIKHYNLPMVEFVNGPSLVTPNGNQHQQFA